MHVSFQPQRSVSCASNTTSRRTLSHFRPRASTSPGSSPNLDDVGKAAQQKLKEVGTNLQDSASRTWRKLEAEYNISEKAERAARRLEEQARDVDQKWNVRRRIRSSIEHVQRMWPVWSSQLDQFTRTWYGKTAVLAVLLLIFSSPWFWRALNLLLLVWWLALPLAAALVTSAQRKAAERAQAEAEDRARRQNPFADMFRTRGTATGGTQPSRGFSPKEGPVIDADFTIIKDDKK